MVLGVGGVGVHVERAGGVVYLHRCAKNGSNGDRKHLLL